MDIGLDARTLLGDRTGVGNYLKHILEAGAFDGHRVVLYYRPRPDVSPPTLSVTDGTTVRWEPVELSSVAALLPYGLGVMWWLHVTLPRALETDDIDCFFGPNFVVPKRYDGPMVAIVHDLAYVQAADTHSMVYRWYLRLSVAATVRRADHLVVVSESTKQDLLDHYGVPSQKVSVCYGAADACFQPRNVSGSTRAELVERYGLASTYALFVGTVEPRKNVHSVVEALGQMDPGTRPQLVVVGNRESSYDELTRMLDRHDVDIVFTGYVPDEELPLLYNLASVFVYPSQYEGFGLPVVEAMQSGTPVLVSDRSSLPEVVGEAGIVVNPTDPDPVATGLSALLEEPAQQRYAAEGVRRAGDFSWFESAKQINGILDGMV